MFPTWELKKASQRKGDVEGGEFDPGYGHIPPLYLSQVVASWWWWHDPEIDRDLALQNLSTLAWKSGTNQAEAHLYFGLIPLLAIIAAAGWHATRQKMLTRFHITWFILGLAAIAYSTGWLIPILKYVPGFTFFRGPGRFGMVATLGMAVAAGAALHLLCGKRKEQSQWVIAAAVFAFTAWEFHYISRHVTYAFQLERTPIHNLPDSRVRETLAVSEHPVRLHAPGPNLTNLLGVSSVPEYLGLGPAEYYVEELKAKPLDLARDPASSREFAEWASRHGVTHVLCFEPLPKLPEWRLILAEPDPFLNSAWARLHNEPLYLYRRTAPSYRAFIETDSGQAPATITRYEANEVEIQVEASSPGQAVLRDLMFPGWEVTVDGESAEAKRCDRLFRAVDVPAGNHTIVWAYRPASLSAGLGVSCAALIILLAIGHVRFWHFSERRGKGQEPGD
ncbi:MAG: YfhO family protein, partial [Planctomycetes bacterium]|nr:YfhO family protein [Planctomycetota bacterium]